MAKGVLGFFFGGKPKVPAYKQVSPESEQTSAIAQNVASLPGAEALAAGVNKFNLEELAKALQFSLPGGLQKAQANINSQLAGELDPSDTSALIRNSTAAGFGMGIGKGGIGRNLVLRDLGRASQAQRQQGFQNFLALSGATQAPRMDVTSMFFSPQQRVNLALSQNENQFSRDWLSSQISAAPHPAGAFSMELLKGAVIAFAGGAGGAMGAKCWVAREVYGIENPRWIAFRQWMIEDAPRWFLRFYNRFGERIAAMIRPFPTVKNRIRAWMDSKIKEKYGS